MNKEDVLIYSGVKILDKLVERDGMSAEEALEYMDFNIEGAYLGPESPIVMWEPEDED